VSEDSGGVEAGSDFNQKDLLNIFCVDAVGSGVSDEEVRSTFDFRCNGIDLAAKGDNGEDDIGVLFD